VWNFNDNNNNNNDHSPLWFFLYFPMERSGRGEPYPIGSIVVVTVNSNKDHPWIYRVAPRDEQWRSAWRGPTTYHKLEPLAFTLRRIHNVTEEPRDDQKRVEEETVHPRYELTLDQPLRVLEKAHPLELGYDTFHGEWKITGGEKPGLYLHGKIEAHDVVHWSGQKKKSSCVYTQPPVFM
jgi:hypothetical protein